jgi:hypothetical protein
MLIIILTELSFLIFRPTIPFQAKKLSLKDYADKVITSCSKKNRAACYDREIPKLMDYISMEDAFEVAKIVQKKDTEYLYCHVLGHNLSYRETGKNPNAWKDVIARCPTTMCNNGCLHGSLLKRFNSEKLTDEQVEAVKSELPDVCEPRGNWNPVEVEKSMCYHGMGHLHMYMTGADIQKSLELCDFIAKKKNGKDYTLQCTQGVFMQIFQPLEPEDFALVKGLTPSKETLENFCSHYKDVPYNVCHTESWPLFRDELYTPMGITEYCAYAKDSLEQKRCVSIAMSMLTTDIVIHQNDLNKLKDLCLGLPNRTMRSTCFSHAALRLIRIDAQYVSKAIEVCSLPDNNDALEEDCFQNLVEESTFSFHRDSSNALSYCQKLPDPWSKKCIKRNS